MFDSDYQNKFSYCDEMGDQSHHHPYLKTLLG